MDLSTQYSRERGSLPNRYWHQLNHRSPEENLAEERELMSANLQEQREQKEIPTVIIQTEVKKQ